MASWGCVKRFIENQNNLGVNFFFHGCKPSFAHDVCSIGWCGLYICVLIFFLVSFVFFHRLISVAFLANLQARSSISLLILSILFLEGLSSLNCGLLGKLSDSCLCSLYTLLSILSSGVAIHFSLLITFSHSAIGSSLIYFINFFTDTVVVVIDILIIVVASFVRLNIDDRMHKVQKQQTFMLYMYGRMALLVTRVSHSHSLKIM